MRVTKKERKVRVMLKCDCAMCEKGIANMKPDDPVERVDRVVNGIWEHYVVYESGMKYYFKDNGRIA